ncbi:MAG: hypothetical protein IPO00_01915 [Betaproteobacteria bacterium]|nr:hypothetical protein [Betaproteobacteria bacterium]
MKNDLQFAQREYNVYFDSTVFPLLNISSDALGHLGFADVARRIEDSRIRRTYRKLAIKLLEANLVDHQADRPSAIAALDVGDFRDLKDWQEFTFSLEKALWELVSQGDT